MNQIQRFSYRFRGVYAIPAAGSPGPGPWVKTITGAAPPTCTGANGGSMDLALTSAVQVQNVCLSMNNILPFRMADLVRLEILASISASLAAAVSAVVGIASARNDDPDAVATNAYFKLAGSNSLVVETDDGTTDNDDKATGLSLSTTMRKLVIDFGTGSNPRNPPSQSQGGLADVRFFAGNANGSLRRVAENTRFDMSAASANYVQLLAQIQKTSDAATGTLSIFGFDVYAKELTA